MAQGGKRKGAGRKHGSTTRPQLRASFNDKELKDFVNDLKAKAKTDPTIMRFVAEQIFGRATQPIGNDEGQPLVISFDSAFKPKFETKE